MGTVLWFAPHQDDETFMGVGVRHHLEAGHDVYVIGCTDGSASAVRQELGMTVSDFVRARDEEQDRASRKLGVLPDDSWRSSLATTDGQLTVAKAAAIIQHELDMLSEVGAPGPFLLKGTTDLAPAARHPDHVALGAALRLYASTHDVRMYVEPYKLAAVKAASPGVTISTERCATPAAVSRAIAEYKLQDPTADMYGIGYRSVADEFDAFAANLVGYYHAP
jgi:hypothetical protein